MTKLLIVDDNQQDIYLLQVLLTRNGFEVETAANGAAALEMARRAPPDMIISDILMPVMDGFALCRDWKADERLKGIPFVFYTATYTDPRDEDLALSLGAARFVVKPSEQGNFLTLLREVIEEREAGRPLASAQSPPEEADYYRLYSESLVRKLEDKMLALEKSNRALEREIAEREQAEEKIRKSQVLFQSTFEQAAVGIAHAAPESQFIRVNRRFCDIVGYTEDELLNLTFQDITYPEDLEADMEHARKLLANEIKTYSTEKRYYRKNGSIVWVNLTVSLVRQSSGKPWYFIAIVEDISRRKEAEETLHKSEGRHRNLSLQFQGLLDAIPDNLTLQSPDLRIIWSNRGSARGLGKETSDLIGQYCYALWHNRTKPCEVCPVRRSFSSGNLENEEVTTPDGRIWDLLAVPIKDDQGKITGVIEVGKNITEQKKTEERFRQAHKMEAIGTLAGGIAHDFNNILSAIIGYTDLAKAQVNDRDALLNDLQEVSKAGIRAKDLVRQILAFSRQSDQELRPVQVKLIAKEALKLLRSSLPATIEIRDNIQSDALVMADPTQIHQVLMNLCTNAGHAMQEKGGILEVGMTDVRLDSDFASKHPDIRPGAFLKLTLRDTGHGIMPDLMDRIFDPFFTTKKKGEGTGMGLSVVHGIVKRLEGAINVYSEPGKGTEFNIYLPAVEREAKAEQRVEEPLPTGTERILFVDDEQTIRDINKKLLEVLGYYVDVRSNGIEALELFKADPKKFDLVITDVTMPNMTGDQLAERLMAVRPDFPVILCTGFSARIDEEKARDMGIRAFVFKPIIQSDMARIIRKVLDNKTD